VPGLRGLTYEARKTFRIRTAVFELRKLVLDFLRHEFQFKIGPSRSRFISTPYEKSRSFWVAHFLTLFNAPSTGSSLLQKRIYTRGSQRSFRLV